MPLICYREQRFQSASLTRIRQANDIIREFQAQGFSLTLRQLFYQFVARDLIPNTMRSYDNLGALINDARLAGRIDWDAIEDRTRNLVSLTTWGCEADIIEACARSYREDLWFRQEYYVECWAEKDAVTGIIEPVCSKWRVPWFSCRGYTSQSEMWGAAMRLKRQYDDGGSIVVIHLGDHDPSGRDMTRDIEDRLKELSMCDEITVRRIALNMDQIRRYNPPPNPCKITDCRAKGYIREFGHQSWELDALNPVTIYNLIEDEIEKYVDKLKWDEDQAAENEAKFKLQKLSVNWPRVEKFLKRIK